MNSNTNNNNDDDDDDDISEVIPNDDDDVVSSFQQQQPQQEKEKEKEEEENNNLESSSSSNSTNNDNNNDNWMTSSTTNNDDTKKKEISLYKNDTTTTTTINNTNDITFRNFIQNGFLSFLSSNQRDSSSTTTTSNTTQQQQQQSFLFLNEIEIHIVDPSSSSSLLTTVPPPPSMPPPPPPLSNEATTTATTTTTTMEGIPSHPLPPTTTTTIQQTPYFSSTTTSFSGGLYYNKFVQLLQQESNNTINYIPIQMFRNNTKGVVEHLKLKPVLNAGGGLLMSSSSSSSSLRLGSHNNNNNTNTNNANNRGVEDDNNTTTTTTTTTRSNPNTDNNSTTSNHPNNNYKNSIIDDIGWHTGPYCYVYFAAIQNLEHYRTRVKPSIQVFVNQLQEAAVAAATKSNESQIINTTSTLSSTTTTTATTTTLPSSTNTTNIPSSNLTTTTTTTRSRSISPVPRTNSSNSSSNKTLLSSQQQQLTTTTTTPTTTARCPPYVLIFVPVGTRENSANDSNTNTPKSFSASRKLSGRYNAAATTLSKAFGGVSRRMVTTTATAAVTTTSTATTTSMSSHSLSSNQSHSTGSSQMSTSSINTGDSSGITTSANNSSNNTNSSSTTTTNNNNNNNESAAPPGQSLSLSNNSVQSPIHRLNRVERELLRRLTVDFPNGNVCTLSTAFLDTTTTATTMTTTSIATSSYVDSLEPIPVDKGEWSVVMKSIANAIGHSFLNRCQNCDDELRRFISYNSLDPQAVTTATTTAVNNNTTTTTTHAQHNHNLNKNNWNYFFLVKESLAFTYEQMNLYEEALLQYEEIRAFVTLHYSYYNINNHSVTGYSGTKKNTKALQGIIDDLESEMMIQKPQQSKKQQQQQKHPSNPTTFTTATTRPSFLTGNTIEFRTRLRSALSTSSLSSSQKNQTRSSPSIRLAIEPDLVEEYLFGRELSLLFKLKEPLRIMDRCIAYIKHWYKQQNHNQVHFIPSLPSNLDSNDQIMATEHYAFNFCWNVHCASSLLYSYLTAKADPQPSIFDSSSPMQHPFLVLKSSRRPASVFVSTNIQNQLHNPHKNPRLLLGHKLCTLLEFAALRMKRIGALLTHDNIQGEQSVTSTIPPTTRLSRLHFLEDPVSWTDGPPKVLHLNQNEQGQQYQRQSDYHTKSLPDSTNPNFLDDALQSFSFSAPEHQNANYNFWIHYKTLLELIMELNASCDRHRYISLYRIELMELHNSLMMAETGHNDPQQQQHNLTAAIKQLRWIVGMYGSERWDTTYFTLLFRLASLERECNSTNLIMEEKTDNDGSTTFTSAAKQYLSTLISCFAEGVTRCAPQQALLTLHNDLLCVVESPLVQGTIFEDTAPLFVPVFGLDGMNSNNNNANQSSASAASYGFEQRNLWKRVYTVGDVVGVTIQLSSFLPMDIVVDDISVSLVPFRTYVAAMEDHIPLRHDIDSFHILHATPTMPQASNNGNGNAKGNGVLIRPGRHANKYTMEWKPCSSGQLIVSSITIRWKNVVFTYTAKAMTMTSPSMIKRFYSAGRQATIRIDIVPSEPTQKLVVTPRFLLPGHEQPLNFAFSAGSDHVKGGTLELVATPGLLFQSIVEPPLPTTQQPQPIVQDKNESDTTTTGKWLTSLSTPVPPCLPGQTVIITTRVKNAPNMVMVSGSIGNRRQGQNKNSNNIDTTAPDVMIEPLVVKLTTSYKYAMNVEDDNNLEYDNVNDNSMCDTLVLETKVPTMNKHIVQVEDYDFVRYDMTSALLNVTIVCNNPVPFTLRGWSVQLPPPFSLLLDNVDSDDKDMNESLRGTVLEYGERFFLCFECTYRDLMDGYNMDSTTTSQTIPRGNVVVVSVDLENEYGTIFREPMSINLSSSSPLASSAISSSSHGLLIHQLGGAYRCTAVPSFTPSLLLSQQSPVVPKMGNNDIPQDPISVPIPPSTVQITLKPSTIYGLVGVPVRFQASFELPSSLCASAGEQKNVVVLYRIVSIDDTWLLGGRIEGMVDNNNYDNKQSTETKLSILEFVAVPTRPGPDLPYPTIRLISLPVPSSQRPTGTALSSSTTTTTTYTPIPTIMIVAGGTKEENITSEFATNHHHHLETKNYNLSNTCSSYCSLSPNKHMSIAFPIHTNPK